MSIDKPRWDNWASLAQEDSKTGRVAMNIGPWREVAEIKTVKMPTRTEAEAFLAEYLTNEVLYPLVDTARPYKPTTGYLDEEYRVMVVICEPIPGDPLEILQSHITIERAGKEK